ncbi:hypothetical protein GOP47_0025915 [Adiantum capillus-veneris]|uniref:Uncharacterized protein n=1 Tax=Adiantum capillus-veneris TaxID=13818 RepID=A0A9D4U3Q0_ADICA|nr:hypothetical protein GOP47_0025915 [Adiantum capillus-veneris]
MEVWILLAAAGSGYLARRWQNAQKPKGSSADEAEDDGGAGPSPNLPSSRGHYRRFSSSGKRQVGKSICGKGSPYWVRPKSTGNLMENRAGNKVMGGEGDRTLSREGHTCNDANGCEICSDSGDVNHSHDGSGVQLDDNELETTPQDESPRDSLYRKRLSISAASSLQSDGYGLERDTMEKDGKGQPSEDFSHQILLRSTSGKRANDSLDGKTRRGGQSHQDGCAGKRMKDALDSSSTANQSEGCVFGSWMPGFWDVSEGVFVLDTESLLVQQGERSRGSSSRKSRTPNKYGRSKGFRKRSLAGGQKPMSSLESCLSAQLDEDYIRRHISSTRHIDDEVLRDSVKRSSRYSASFASEATTEELFNPFACRRYESASGAKWESKKGRVGSSIKGLLFNFGVGVGMMFTVMSNMREVRRLTLLLKEAESLIKDLEDELEGKDESKSDLGSLKNGIALEQRQIFVSNTLRKVKSATESLYSMQMMLSNEPAATSTLEHVPSKDMLKLERELEAELERMELSLGDGDDRKLQNKSTGSSECGEVGNLVQGELTILGIPHEVEVDSDEDSSSSSHEDLHVRNYAVSPRALAKRLHEVLEARQEERISQLESDLKTLNSKLQAKEEEVRWLKENSHSVHAAGDTQEFPAVQQSSPKRSLLKKSGFSKREKDASQLKIIRSPNPSPISPYTASDVFSDVSVFKKGIEDKSTAFITLGGEALEAYKEACDEFSKLSTSGSEGTLMPESRLSERHGKEKCTREGKIEAKPSGSSDGWEQVDLLSLAEDFYGGGDPDLLESMPSWSKTSLKERRGPRRKSRIKGHPEPEQPFSNSRGVDSSDDATNDTSGSTPCSIKFIDVRTVAYSQSDDKQGGMEEGDCDWSPDILIRAGVNTPNQEEYHSIHPEVDKSSGRFLPSSRQGDWNLSDDSEYYSELDEQLGQLLIKRIVEKSRKGSPIVQDAQTVLAHLEKNEQVHASD